MLNIKRIVYTLIWKILLELDLVQKMYTHFFLSSIVGAIGAPVGSPSQAGTLVTHYQKCWLYLLRTCPLPPREVPGKENYIPSPPPGNAHNK